MTTAPPFAVTVDFHLFHSTRPDLLERLGRHGEAAEAYDAALAKATNAAERRFLQQRRHELAGR